MRLLFSRVRFGALSSTIALVSALMAPSSGHAITLLDLEGAVDLLRTDTNDALNTQAGLLSGLRTDTTGNTNALTAQAGLLSGLRTDLGGLGTRLGSVDTDVANLKVQVGDLRGILDALPDLAGPDGIPLDLPGIIDKLNADASANATSIAEVKIDVSTLRNTVVTQTGRIDDQERRIARNTSDIQRHDLAISDLQSQMASGFAGVQKELRDHDRRIDKATEGVAMAFAMKSPTVPENRNFAISGSFGAFENKTAVAFSGGVRASDALQFDAGVAVGLDEGSVGGRAGATLAW